MELTQQKVLLNQDVLMQNLGAEAVFLNCEREEYFSLNEVGRNMLSALQSSPSIQAAYERLLAEYEVEPEQLKQDLLNLIEQLLENGLVEVTEA